MNILIIGLGSIGQRHLRNLQKIKPSANFFTIRKKDRNILIKDKKKIKSANLQNYFKIKKITLKEVERIKIDLTLICNPTSLHSKYLYFFLKKNSHIFVEKPLYCSSKELAKIIKLNKKYKRIINVGYQFRFHPLIKLVKKIICDKRFGPVISASFTNKCYLPDFHPYENYKKSYAAIKKLGGGVLNTLSHEVDLIAFFFGLPKKKFSFETNSKRLKINANDIFEAILFYESNSFFNVNLSLSLSEKNEKKRNFEIIFSKGKLICDIKKNNLRILNFKSKKIQTINYKNGLNQIYVDELKSMLKNMKKKFPTNISLEKNLETELLLQSFKI